MTPEEMRKIKKSLKIYALQENSKSFKERKREMFLDDAKKQKEIKQHKEKSWQAE